MTTNRPNWVHLDLKGVIPSEAQLLAWIDFLADCSFDGIVWEYEDRLPWRSWPGAYRPGYDLAVWQRLWQRCADRNLTITPLIQVQGHLEWLLQDHRFAPWREAGHYSEICPQHPDVQPALRRWIDEVIALHPHSRYIHLGADETRQLATCPQCQARASRHPHGRMGVYLDHIGALCQHVLDRGRTPMIWADMFWPDDAIHLAAQLPAGVAIVDWQYSGAGPFPTTDKLRASGRELWGASSVRSIYEPKYTLGMLQPHLNNILGWHQLAQAGQVHGLIHTFWSRTNSLGLLYGPWHGWLPGFIAAGSPQRWPQHPLRELIQPLDQALAAPEWVSPGATIKRFESARTGDPFADGALEWWSISLKHRALLERAVSFNINQHAWLAVERHRGIDPIIASRSATACNAIRATFATLDQDIRAFWDTYQLSDRDEYLDSKLHNLQALLSPPATCDR